jgi:putative transcription factor
MQCEVCGRQIRGKPYRTIIEGARMIACNECAKLGSGYWDFKPLRSDQQQQQRKILPRTKRPTMIAEDLELTDDVGLQVRRAREEMNLSHKDLGRKIGEKVSVLRKIEIGKMTPNQTLIQKLEHALKIRLLAPPSEPQAPIPSSSRSQPVTLGELISLKVKEAEVAKEREPS